MPSSNASKSKKNVDSGVPDRIEEFVPGDRERTPWSARVMNQIIRVINRNSNIKAAPDTGLTVYKSDNNIIIGKSGVPLTEPTVPEEGEGDNVISGSTGNTINYYCNARYV